MRYAAPRGSVSRLIALLLLAAVPVMFVGCAPAAPAIEEPQAAGGPVSTVSLGSDEAAETEVELPRIFSDHMVLQGGRNVPVWGWATPRGTVTVQIAGKTVKAKATRGGVWKVMLPKLKPGGPFEMTVAVEGGNTILIKDVLVGEVWMCSGQSNMVVPVGLDATMGWWKGVLNHKEEAAKADHPKIRVFHVPYTWKKLPVEDVDKAKWIVCTPKEAAKFSGTAYFFGRKLQAELKQPVGLITTAVGGQIIEQFTPKSGQAFWYNGMVAPLATYGIRGAIWYQGESNWKDGYDYFPKQKALIESWRKAWGQGDFPFYIVQIAPLKYGLEPHSLPRLWEAQAATLSIPNTGIASTMDVGDVNDIHPRDKRSVGERLALWALAKDYGRDIVYSGPHYKSMKIEGNKIRISFDHTGSGIESRDGKPLSHFEIAGEAVYVPAKAVIEGKTIVVSSDKVAKPMAVRFAWQDVAQPNLQNKDGLPAYPFRTASSAPSISGAKLFGKSIKVKMECVESNGVIRYTRDGSLPTAKSAKYDKHVELKKTTTLRARFFRKDGLASTTVSETFVQAKPVKYNGKELLPGMKYDYYEGGTWESMPDFSKLTPEFSGIVPDFTLNIGELEDFFALRFKGYVLIKTAGEYTFELSSDDGSMLYINGKELINNDGLHPVRPVTGKITLKPGMHKLLVTYFEWKLEKGLILKYKGPGVPMQNVQPWCEQ